MDNRESIFDARLTTPTHISYSDITDLLNNSMFHPILAENNGSPTLYMTFLNTMLALPTVICTSLMAALYSTAHTNINIGPDICTLTFNFCLAQSSDNQGSDNRGWAVLYLCFVHRKFEGSRTRVA